MVTEITIQEAFQLNLPLIDVRSPGEYEKGHIPKAHNIPLFTNDERAHVGTVYKQKSKEKAIELGYTYVNPKLEDFIIQSEKVAPEGKVMVHCWRGGMRSRSFAQHLSDNGFTSVYQIVGGYKAYRNYLLSAFEKPFDLKVLGGYTGSGKTYILKEIKKLGKQVIDLEGIAHHKGSAFGNIGEDAQPTVEQFENNLFEQWRFLNFNEPIWLEDESHNIGSVKIPMPLFNQMRSARLYFLDIPKEERAKHLVKEYTNCGNHLLEISIHKIAKRLGGLNVKNSIDLLNQGNYYEVALIALHYYDKSYSTGMNSRASEHVVKIQLPGTDHANNALKIEQINLKYDRDKINSI